MKTHHIAGLALVIALNTGGTSADEHCSATPQLVPIWIFICPS
jgi:hypothetical protein